MSFRGASRGRGTGANRGGFGARGGELCGSTLGYYLSIQLTAFWFLLLRPWGDAAVVRATS